MKCNTYKIEGEITKIYDSKNRVALIDTEDLERVKQYYWMQQSNGYWIATRDNKQFRLHQFIMNFPKGKVVDHKYNNKFDNRKSKLRVCTQQQNSFNTKLNKRDKGVYKVRSGRYSAKIMINGKSKHLGTFDTKDEAISRRLEEEKKLFKEFSREV